MTCIVGIKQDKVYMGADSALTMGSHIISVSDKLILHNNVLLGFAGPRIQQEFLAHIDIKPEMETNGNCAEAALSIMKNKEMDGAVLFSAGKELTFMTKHGWTRIVENYYAIGDGFSYALGSLFSTSGNIIKPQERIELALKAAEKYCNTVRAPFHFMEVE